MNHNYTNLERLLGARSALFLHLSLAMLYVSRLQSVRIDCIRGYPTGYTSKLLKGHGYW